MLKEMLVVSIIKLINSFLKLSQLFDFNEIFTKIKTFKFPF